MSLTEEFLFTSLFVVNKSDTLSQRLLKIIDLEDL